ncbi:MAG TPA: hypothetical protein VK469_09140 [Candidatus Kapabacteria bacterium]|nr:hypothetical protein [Candidatus Kapabacteria bacterium]
MNILFVPMPEGGTGHIVPLLALASRLKDSQYKTALLLSSQYHNIVRHLGFNVLDIDYAQSEGGFLKELSAFKKFNPDVVLDDSSLTTLFSTWVSKKPRVAIQRTGMYPGANPRQKNKKYNFDIIISVDKYKDYVKGLGMTEIKHYTDLFAAEMKIVPGIQTIEVLPDHLQSDPTYVFCGPLIANDYFFGVDSPTVEKNGTGKSDSYKLLESFFCNNKNRFKVLFTYGTFASRPQPIFKAIKYLLNNNVAVIASMKIPELEESHRDLCFCANYLPMNFVCSRVDLMIHHCGSGTYQYQILHQLPSITIGTDFQDREDVAIRLEELGVNCHLPSPDDCENFLQLFQGIVEKYAQLSSPLYQAAKKKLVKLKEETDRVCAAFDLQWVLEQAVERFARI